MTPPYTSYSITQSQVLLVYALIPGFIILLAILLFFVIRSQWGLMVPQSEMPAVSKDPKVNVAGYAMVGVLFLLFIAMAVVSRKQQVPA
jgi:hypothetical protein